MIRRRQRDTSSCLHYLPSTLTGAFLKDTYPATFLLLPRLFYSEWIWNASQALCLKKKNKNNANPWPFENALWPPPPTLTINNIIHFTRYRQSLPTTIRIYVQLLRSLPGVRRRKARQIISPSLSLHSLLRLLLVTLQKTHLSTSACSRRPVTCQSHQPRFRVHIHSIRLLFFHDHVLKQKSTGTPTPPITSSTSKKVPSRNLHNHLSLVHQA